MTIKKEFYRIKQKTKRHISGSCNVRWGRFLNSCRHDETRRYKVIGITLKLYDDSKETAHSKQCCAGQDIMDAKRVAQKLNIEHKILYYQNKFKEGVINNFVESYLNGETPIPCIQCNKTVKFNDLFESKN